MKHFALEALGWRVEGSQGRFRFMQWGGPGAHKDAWVLRAQGPQAFRLDYPGPQEPLGALKNPKEDPGMSMTPDSI